MIKLFQFIKQSFIITFCLFPLLWIIYLIIYGIKTFSPKQSQSKIFQKTFRISIQKIQKKINKNPKLKLLFSKNINTTIKYLQKILFKIQTPQQQHQRWYYGRRNISRFSTTKKIQKNKISGGVKQSQKNEKSLATTNGVSVTNRR